MHLSNVLSLLPRGRARFDKVAVVFMALCFTAGPARADATVIVELKLKAGAPVDGVVELVKGDSRHSCTTQGGRCEIQGVAGGLYSVEVKVSGRPSPKPKQVMIPPSGEARLVVSAD